MRIAKTLKSFLVWLKIMTEEEEEEKIMEEETLKIMTEEEEEIMEEETLKIMTEEEEEIMEEETLKIMTEEEEEKIMEEETLKTMTEEEEEIIIMEMSTTTPILLPQEIHIEILSWIPAKSLISNFKLVCKSWRNLIKDPDFIKMHLNRGRRSRRSNNETLVRKSKSGNAIFQLHPPLNFNDKKGLVFLNPIIEEAKKMDIDSSLLELKSRLVGSCNGLLCLSVALDDERIILLNPSTKKYRASPEQLFDITDSIFPKPVTYGFGCYYNSATAVDEYKVVRMAYFYPFGHEDDEDNHYFEFQIDIYSMSSNSWRRWRKVKEEEDVVVPYEISLHRSGVFVNGAFHWMGCKRRSGYIWDTIVSFNIRDEEFGPQVPVPPPCEIVIGFDDDEYPYIKNDSVLMNVRGYLGNVYFSRDEMTDIELEIWVMKEYGIKESWTKQFVISSYDSDPPCELYGSSIYSTAMSCFLIGDQILIEGRVFFGSKGASMRKGKGYERVILYDMNKKKIGGEFRMVDIPCVAQDDQVDYIETLVSLESSVFPLSNNQKREDMESLRNQIFEYSCEV